MLLHTLALFTVGYLHRAMHFDLSCLECAVVHFRLCWYKRSTEEQHWLVQALTSVPSRKGEKGFQNVQDTCYSVFYICISV